MFLRKDVTRLSADGHYFFVDLRPHADFCMKYSSFGDGLTLFHHIPPPYLDLIHMPVGRIDVRAVLEPVSKDQDRALATNLLHDIYNATGYGVHGI